MFRRLIRLGLLTIVLQLIIYDNHSCPLTGLLMRFKQVIRWWIQQRLLSHSTGLILTLLFFEGTVLTHRTYAHALGNCLSTLLSLLLQLLTTRDIVIVRLLRSGDCDITRWSSRTLLTLQSFEPDISHIMDRRLWLRDSFWEVVIALTHKQILLLARNPTRRLKRFLHILQSFNFFFIRLFQIADVDLMLELVVFILLVTFGKFIVQLLRLLQIIHKLLDLQCG